MAKIRLFKYPSPLCNTISSPRPENGSQNRVDLNLEMTEINLCLISPKTRTPLLLEWLTLIACCHKCAN
ncbi:hypothetical protein BpHYR1_052305 [Brachionus plicatilis]|uniref:Uncharacterized protein n=1 Tax=Brachionus plicatilis TaxID=10195 RepID=A0A3M7QUC2_BRAPC|nr:hypothetical protein BpHYR1_052305 [Brachionus plicatilis]